MKLSQRVADLYIYISKYIYVWQEFLMISGNDTWHRRVATCLTYFDFWDT